VSTSPIVVLVNQDALTIKADATFALTTGTLQSFSDLTDLADAVPQINPYATFEPDFWLLDGNYKIKPSTTVRVGLMTTNASSGVGSFAFSPSPVLQITFGSAHSTTSGLTFYFSEYSNDFADSIFIEYYDASNALIRDDEYEPTSAVFSTGQAVADFKKIIIYFDSANKASHYLRLTGIDFDDLVTWSGSEIKAARVVEQVNPLSVEVPTNTLDLTLFSSAGAFSIVNPTGVYAGLQYNDPLDVYEELSGEVVYIGRFYLDEWESQSANLATFKCVDALGVGEIDATNYYTTQEGVWINEPLADTISEIMTGTGIEYEIDASFAGVGLYGWLPVMTKRETLQQIAFTIGAYVTCARSNKILIKPFELADDLVSYDHTLTGADKGLVSPVTRRPLVTGVKILTSYYNYLTANKIVFNGTLSTGDYIILFPDGVINETATQSGGTGVKTAFFPGANHMPFTVTSAGTFEFTSQLYFERLTSPTTLNNGSLPAGTLTNIINIDNAALVTSGIVNNEYSIVDNVIQRVYDYYNQRYIQKTKLFASPVVVGDSILIDTQSSRQIKGIVERMTTDLAGGFVSDLEIVGVVVAI
jgi:hypothetical protein